MSMLGKTVIYGTEGVCEVTELCKMKIGSTRGEYYVLKPIHRPGATVFVPAANETLLAKMRPILSHDEIDALIDGAGAEGFDWPEDHAERKIRFQQILLGGDRQELLGMIRCIYLHRQQLHCSGKRLRSHDEQMLRDAEKLLNDEFALVLQIPQQDVPEYIRARLEAKYG